MRTVSTRCPSTEVRGPVARARRVSAWVGVWVCVLLAVSAGVVLGASPSGAQSGSCGEKGCARVLEVSGLIDPVMVDFVESGVAEAQRVAGVRAVVLTLNSPGVVVDDDRFVRFAEALRRSTVPVTVWVGPSGSEALGGAAELVAALPGSTMANGSRIGEVGEPRVAAAGGNTFEGDLRRLRTSTVDADEAERLGLIDRVVPVAGEHLAGLPGVESRITEDKDGRQTRELETVPVVAKLPLIDQLFHTVASPAVAYLLLAVGIGLLIFEFFTAGVGVAGVLGAASALAAGYGLGVLPTRTWAVVLLLGAGIAFAIDVQAGVPRFWSGIGMIAWMVGSLYLFSGVTLPVLALVTGIVGMGVAMLSGMPAMVRSRFGTPTIGRERMIGAMGSAVTAVSPEGTVRIDGGLWRARTNRATPVAEGEPVRVVAIDGLTLEVEPEEGGAVDYRDARSNRSRK